MAKKKDNKESVIIVNGEQMTVEQRNRRMKYYYLTGTAQQEIADMFNLSHNTVRKISSQEGWKEAKSQLLTECGEDVDKKLKETYVNTKVDILVQYDQTYSGLMERAEYALRTGKGITYTDGTLNVNKFKTLVEAIRMCQEGQERTTGFLPRDVQLKLQMNQEKLDIKKQLLGLGEDDVIEDNFLEALGVIAEGLGTISEEGELD